MLKPELVPAASNEMPSGDALPARPAEEPGTAAEQPLPLYIKVCWGVGGLGAQLLINVLGAVALFYLTTIVGVSALVAGNLVMISKIYDAVSDPVTGALSDHARFAAGRRRPFLLVGALLSAVSVILAFTIPFDGQGPLTWAWILFTLILCTSGYSAFNVPYMAMPAEMTTGYHERSSIHSWRVVFALAGTMLASSGAGIILAHLAGPSPTGKGHAPNTAEDFHILSYIFAAIILITMLITWWGTRRAPTVARTQTVLPWSEQSRLFLKNRAFLVILAAKACQLLGVAATASASFFLVVNVLERSPAAMAWIGIPFIAAGMVATPVLLALSKRIGKRRAFLISVFTAGAGALSWVVAQPSDPIWTMSLRGITSGIGFSGSILFAMSMLTDAIEVDAVHSGMRREGMYMALYSFAEKLAAALGPGIVGAALTYAGFDKGAEVTAETAERVRQATLLGAAYIPAVCATTAGLLIGCFYRIDSHALARAGSMFERRTLQ